MNMKVHTYPMCMHQYQIHLQKKREQSCSTHFNSTQSGHEPERTRKNKALGWALQLIPRNAALDSISTNFVAFALSKRIFQEEIEKERKGKRSKTHRKGRIHANKKHFDNIYRVITSHS